MRKEGRRGEGEGYDLVGLTELKLKLKARGALSLSLAFSKNYRESVPSKTLKKDEREL